MNKLDKAIHSLSPDLKYVEVTFFGSIKHYYYKTLLNFNVGDLAVVNTPRSGPAVVKVITLIPFEDMKALDYPLKWIVDRVDPLTSMINNDVTEKAQACIES